MHTLTILLLSLLLAACAGIDRTERSLPDAPTVYDTWQVDSDRQNAAIRQLVDQSDRLIDAGRLRDAEVVLNRSLRIDNRIASVWSRLAWLSLQQGAQSRARDYISKSNSLAGDTRLLGFNWQLYREASAQLGDDSGVSEAEQQLEALP